MITRYLETYLSQNKNDFEKMIFIAGPRQIGKTTLLENLAKVHKGSSVHYLNWDNLKSQAPIRDIQYTYFEELRANAKQKPYIIFDELHKYPKWKSFLKGFFDTFKNDFFIAVTGSAKMNIYRRGGDSLLGRYWLLRFNPLSLNELLGHDVLSVPISLNIDPVSKKDWGIYEKLFEFGGFPDPFIKADKRHHTRWIASRNEKLVLEDLRDLSRIHDLNHVANLMQLLAGRAGGLLSVNSLREDLNTNYQSLKIWINWLEALYYCFTIKPYSKKISNSLKKEPKIYLTEWSEIKEPGTCFENMMAVMLKKSVEFWNDIGSGRFELFFVRDTQKREVDFLITSDQKPWMLVECKLSAQEVPDSLYYYQNLLKPEHTLLVTHGSQGGIWKVKNHQKVLVLGAPEFLQNFV